MYDESRYGLAEILRRQGKSYNTISLELGVAKSTLSNWFANKTWSVGVKDNLNNLRLKNAIKNLSTANLARSKIQKERRGCYLKEAQNEFEKLVSNPLFLVGLGIYWGEGDKTDNGRVAVINTDPELLRTVVRFYRQCLGISDGALRVGLFIYEDVDEGRAVEFWSNLLNIPRQQFIKVQVLKSRSRLTKHRTKYGICSLYFSSTRFSIKIHEWIRLLSIHKFKKLRV